MRSVLALLGGFSISALGVTLTLTTVYDLAGVLLIAAGGLVAALGPRVLGRVRAARSRTAVAARTEPRARGSLGARLAQGSGLRRRAG